MAKTLVWSRLHHMTEAINAIERLCTDKDFASYSGDPDLVAAVERYIERLSEASRNVPDELKQQHPHIDWRGVADIGNVLRHAYDQVIDQEVWEAVTKDLAPLRLAVAAILEEIAKEPTNRNGETDADFT